MQRRAISGGACAKYEVASQGPRKLAKDAPNPFAARQRLLAELGVELPGRPVVAIPRTGPIAGTLPWLATLVHELGFSVRILSSDADSMARGEQLCNSFDSCGPTKIAHAICDTDAEFLFFPKILDIADPQGRGGQTCVTEQAMPEFVEQALRARGRSVRVLRPCLSFSGGRTRLADFRALTDLARELGVGLLALRSALAAATVAQEEFEARLLGLGREALAYARERKLPIVVVCGPLHVIHDRALNATIPEVLHRNGAMAIPMDCFPVGAETPQMSKVYWGDSNRFLRAAATARESRDVFPIQVSSFGCGPASFTEHVFHSLLEGYPHTILETDGHGGTAGYVTRVQAFLQSARQFMAEEATPALPDPRKLLSCLGCDNGLIGESFLRHHREIPIYCYYDDGTPIDERRLSSFVFRLRRAGRAL